MKARIEISSSMTRRLDAIIEANGGHLTRAAIVYHALEHWLANPVIKIKPLTEEQAVNVKEKDGCG